MIEKGANINTISLSLLDDDILYLIQRGIKKFGKYDRNRKNLETMASGNQDRIK